MKIRDIGIVFDGPHATPKRVDSGKYFLNISSLQNGRLKLENSDHVVDEDFVRWTKRVQPRKDDLLFSYETRLGEAALMPEGIEACLGRRMGLIRPNSNKINSRFLLYYWLSPAFQNQISARTLHGSTVPRISIKELPDWEIEVPEISQQSAIADVLGALDDKIAANQQVINAQDVLVQSLVRRENQAGVCIRLDDIAKSVSRGVAPKYTDDGSLVVNQRCIRNQAVDLTAARTLSNLPENKAKRLEPSDVLINSTGVGTLGRAARWIERIPDATADSHVSIVKFDERKVDPEFAGVVLTSMEKQIEDLAEGTTGQTELRRDLLSGLPLQLPRIKVQRQVGAQIRQFDASKRALEKENQVLAATRDELLPLLMNGKITVAEAKEVAGDVGVVKQNQQEEGDSSV